jgi:hypothetical protein
VHEFIQGSNGILRINGKQATRLTKKELLAIARNENIAQVNNKMKPANIIAHLTRKTAPKGIGLFDVTIGTTKYKFLANARVRRLKPGAAATTREWATMKPAERNAIITKYIKKNDRANFAKYSIANQYGIIYQKRGSPVNQSPGSVSSTGSSFERSLENMMRSPPNNRNFA